MHSLEDIYVIIHEAKQYEANGEYLHAYQTYRQAIDAVDNDDDSYPFAGINPAPFDDAQYYALCRCGKVWYRLSEEEKQIVKTH